MEKHMSTESYDRAFIMDDSEIIESDSVSMTFYEGGEKSSLSDLAEEFPADMPKCQLLDYSNSNQQNNPEKEPTSETYVTNTSITKAVREDTQSAENLTKHRLKKPYSKLSPTSLAKKGFQNKPVNQYVSWEKKNLKTVPKASNIVSPEYRDKKAGKLKSSSNDSGIGPKSDLDMTLEQYDSNLCFGYREINGLRGYDLDPDLYDTVACNSLQDDEMSIKEIYYEKSKMMKRSKDSYYPYWDKINEKSEFDDIVNYFYSSSQAEVGAQDLMDDSKIFVKEITNFDKRINMANAKSRNQMENYRKTHATNLLQEKQNNFDEMLSEFFGMYCGIRKESYKEETNIKINVKSNINRAISPNFDIHSQQLYNTVPNISIYDLYAQQLGALPGKSKYDILAHKLTKPPSRQGTSINQQDIILPSTSSIKIHTSDQLAKERGLDHPRLHKVRIPPGKGSRPSRSSRSRQESEELQPIAITPSSRSRSRAGSRIEVSIEQSGSRITVKFDETEEESPIPDRSSRGNSRSSYQTSSKLQQQQQALPVASPHGNDASYKWESGVTADDHQYYGNIFAPYESTPLKTYQRENHVYNQGYPRPVSQQSQQTVSVSSPNRANSRIDVSIGQSETTGSRICVHVEGQDSVDNNTMLGIKSQSQNRYSGKQLPQNPANSFIEPNKLSQINQTLKKNKTTSLSISASPQPNNFKYSPSINEDIDSTYSFEPSKVSAYTNSESRPNSRHSRQQAPSPSTRFDISIENSDSVCLPIKREGGRQTPNCSRNDISVGQYTLEREEDYAMTKQSSIVSRGSRPTSRTSRNSRHSTSGANSGLEISVTQSDGSKIFIRNKDLSFGGTSPTSGGFNITLENPRLVTISSPQMECSPEGFTVTTLSTSPQLSDIPVVTPCISDPNAGAIKLRTPRTLSTRSSTAIMQHTSSSQEIHNFRMSCGSPVDKENVPAKRSMKELRPVSPEDILHVTISPSVIPSSVNIPWPVDPYEVTGIAPNDENYISVIMHSPALQQPHRYVSNLSPITDSTATIATDPMSTPHKYIDQFDFERKIDPIAPDKGIVIRSSLEEAGSPLPAVTAPRASFVRDQFNKVASKVESECQIINSHVHHTHSSGSAELLMVKSVVDVPSRKSSGITGDQFNLQLSLKVDSNKCSIPDGVGSRPTSKNSKITTKASSAYNICGGDVRPSKRYRMRSRVATHTMSRTALFELPKFLTDRIEH